MNVLIIPEDFRKDQFVLKPIISKMLAQVGKPQAKVQICMDPLLGGIGEALKWERIREVLQMYPMVQLFLLIVDRDGQSGRRVSLNSLEKHAEKFFSSSASPGSKLLAENAWQEIEVWALAGQDSFPKGWNWAAIRAEIDSKEKYFIPYADIRGLLDEPGQGRTTLGREAARNYVRVRTRCREDVAVLEQRLKIWFTINPE